MLCSGVISSELLCSDIVLLIEDIVMLIGWFGLVNGGSLVWIVMVVMFFSCGLMLVGMFMFSLLSRFFRFCMVKGVWLVWLLLLFRLIIRL